ncbi:MAG: hypothetical protein M3Y77_16440 [Actinomycetota bacterium]|nr:hypothetical protein [Actinomycetota bacterium]
MTDSQLPERGREPMRPTEAQAGRTSGRRGKLIMIAVAALVIVGAGAVIVLHRSGSSAPQPVAAASTLSAVRATANSGTRPFIISGALAPALAAYFRGQNLSGRGIADFRNDNAQWTLTVPDQVGKTINVFAAHDKTYVDVGATGRWVLLQSADDYRGYDQVPLVRDLVVLTNPFRALNLVESTRAAPQPKHLSLGNFRGQGLAPRRAPAAYTRSLVATAAPADCNNGSGASTQGGQSAQGTPDAKALTADFGVTNDAQRVTLGSWTNPPTLTTDSVDSGVCTITAAFKTPTLNGFDYTIQFDNPPGRPPTLIAPNLLRTFTYTHVFRHAVPCDQGVWTGPSKVSLPGFTVGVGTDASVSQPRAAGYGTLTLKLAGGAAVVSSNETISLIETSTLFVPTTVGKTIILVPNVNRHPVAYTRNVDGSGTSQVFGIASTSGNDSLPDPVALPMNLTLPLVRVDLTETGSVVGAKSDMKTKTTYNLGGTFDCLNHTLTLDTSTLFGATTLKQTSFRPQELVGHTERLNWRDEALTQPPTPSPTTSSSAAVAPPVVGAGIGISERSWDAHHQVDPAIDGAFDPNSGAYPGSPSQDQFLSVQYLNGLVDSYIQQFVPNTNQAAADTQVRGFLPADAVHAVPATPVGTCAAEEWTSRSLAAAVGNGSQGTITVTYAAQYGFSRTSYNPADDRTAFIQIGFGAVIPQTELTATICG